MENGDAPPAAAAQEHAQADLGLQQQVNYLQQQLYAQQQLFVQQQQFWLAQQHAPRPRMAEPHKVKLPTIWTTQIRSWFQTAESQFGTYAVNHPRQRFDLLVAALTDEARMHAKAVVENPDAFQDPYLALRGRLLEVYQPSTWQLAAEFLQHKDLGDRKPSDLLDEMLALLPADLTILVKAAFLGRLPADMRDHVQQGAELLSYQQLAARADEIWNSRRANNPATVAAIAEPASQTASQPQQHVDPEELEQILAAVRFVRQQPKASVKQQKSGQQNQRVLCRRHERYGNRAYRCDAPATCQFSKN